MVFGRHMRDLLPAVKTKYEPMKDYFMSHELRERMLAKRREQDGNRLLKGTREYDQLPEGTEVLIQNQTGPNPTKWDKSGVILENRPHAQVLIRVHGSNRATLRNRRFIKPLYRTDVFNGQKQIGDATKAPKSKLTVSLDRERDNFQDNTVTPNLDYNPMSSRNPVLSNDATTDAGRNYPLVGGDSCNDSSAGTEKENGQNYDFTVGCPAKETDHFCMNEDDQVPMSVDADERINCSRNSVRDIVPMENSTPEVNDSRDAATTRKSSRIKVPSKKYSSDMYDLS